MLPAEAYFDDAWARCAAAPGPVHRRNITIAGRTLGLDLRGGMGASILPALAHLPESAAPPDLTVLAADGIMLRPGWDAAAYGRDGVIAGFTDARFHCRVQSEPTILGMIDSARRSALCWTLEASALPIWERGAPLRPLLHEWLRREGLLPIHGGAVGHPAGGLLIAGAGGRGKSNVALACLDSGLRYAADDFSVVDEAQGWTVHSLYCTGKLAAGDLVRHPGLRGRASNPARLDREKALFFLQEDFASRLIGAMPLRAIVMPRVVGAGPCEIVPATPAAAQRALAVSTIGLARWIGGETFARGAALVRALPCFELRVGAALGEVPGCLDRLLDRLHSN